MNIQIRQLRTETNIYIYFWPGLQRQKNGQVLLNNLKQCGISHTAQVQWTENILYYNLPGVVTATITITKDFFSILLFAVIDANYNLIFADVGCQGRISDGGVFRNTEIYRRMQANLLQLPTATCLENREKNVLYRKHIEIILRSGFKRI